MEISENIFRPGVSTLKVRTTRQRAKVLVDDFIEIPRQLIDDNQDFILCIDIMFINQQTLLTTIFKIHKVLWVSTTFQ